MKILICAATSGELDGLKAIRSDRHSIDFVVTGVGMVSTAYYLTKQLTEKKYDLAINCGIAGSFDRSITIGEVVYVSQEVLSEVGAEDGDRFLSLPEMGLTGEYHFESLVHERYVSLTKFRNVRSITVNTVHGNEESISKIVERLNPEIETMEGAAFYFVCEKENVMAIQLRAVSNYVERRNREAWNIPLAAGNLYTAVNNFINEI